MSAPASSRPPQPESLRVEVIERGVGTAKARFRTTEAHLNGRDMVHGGIIAGLLDVIMSMAAGSHPDPDQRRFSITLSMSINFVGAAGAETLGLAAETTGGGRRTCFCEARISDAAGLPVATAQGTFKLLDAGSERDLIGDDTAPVQ
ncbi:MAG: PaaI family thioesterase [Alphaproteobacteria bacterium]|jgi:uncharacterized protein (TIGR00369 family)|nr:PaaI family thioesterase [Alphaproteobacteria bacterium]MDP6568145.1 PaaI family thioesterase [Alphaproteobacteria bacterium]MDP6812837.1 PaaI family thioesterase [Alphaproteobacteria bacterium]